MSLVRSNKGLNGSIKNKERIRMYGSHGTVECPKCRTQIARFQSVVFTGGTRRRRIICYNPVCRAESY